MICLCKHLIYHLFSYKKNNLLKSVSRHLAFVYDGKINDMNFTKFDWGHTDITRLHQGHVAGQFWSIYYECDDTEANQLLKAMETIDVVKRMVNLYPNTFQIATNTKEFSHALRHGKIASAMGIEGGQMIDSSMVALRQFYDLGVRYMTVSWFLFHICSMY